MMAAKDAVFDTAELLEMILFELPTKDLLLSTGVSQSWKAAIKSSKRLQRALFYITDDLWALEYQHLPDRRMLVHIFHGNYCN